MRGSLVVLCWVSIDVVLECWIGGDVVSECTEVVFVVMHGCTGKLYCEQGNVLRTEVADVVILDCTECTVVVNFDVKDVQEFGVLTGDIRGTLEVLICLVALL